jgi:hypothetical protein
MTVSIFPKFITPEECNILNLWTTYALKHDWLDKGIDRTGDPREPNRYSTHGNPHKFGRYPDIAYSIYDRISKFLDLRRMDKSVTNGGKDGIVVSCTLLGGDIFKHIDVREPGNFHLLRCNILTQAPEIGGQLVVNGNKIDVEIGDLHCYINTKYQHSVSLVQGNINRILWMFGYQISEGDPRFSRWV